MENNSAQLQQRFDQDLAKLLLERLISGTLIACLIAIVLFFYSLSGHPDLQRLMWCGAISLIVAARLLSVFHLNRSVSELGMDDSLFNFINRFAWFSGVADGVIWSSANWIIFSESLGNHYLILSLTIGAAITYGLIYLLKPLVAMTASGLAILPILVFAYANQGEEFLQLSLFVSGFCLVLMSIIAELRKLIINYRRESFEHRTTAEKEKRANFIFNQYWQNTPLAAIEWDQQFRVCNWNPSAERVFGYTVEEALGKPLTLIFSAEDAEKIKAKWRRIWCGQDEYRSVQVCRHKSGREIHCEWHDSTINPDTYSRGITSFVDDISNQVANQEIIKTQANFDSLTGLPNRRQMMEQIDRLLDKSRLTREFFALVFLDLDDFKDINDTRGHEVGDAVLKAFAANLRKTVRHNDIVARFGGDEFVVLLDDLGKNYQSAIRSASYVTDKLMEAGLDLRTDDDQTFHLDISGGISLFNGTTEGDANTLLKSADLAMYQVKQNGKKGISFYDESLSLEAEYRVEVLQSLRMSHENREFELHCQPIFSADGRLCFFENLLRWQRGSKTTSASDFIHILANSAMMVDVGYWIIEKVCLNLNQLQSHRAWPTDGAFFVNVSPKQLKEQDFSDRVIKILEKHQIDPRLIVFEITEESLINDYEIVLQQLQKLVSQGIRIALDDFGSGYSSLALLKDLPSHFLKLDKTFIQDLLASRHNQSIVEAVIKLCDVLSLQVIAEGVETEEQYHSLMKLGCDFVQGYYFSKPLSIDGVLSLLGQSQSEPSENYQTGQGEPVWQNIASA